ncbi:MAG: T9SS type A sorting domain-containing protein [Muribaculaceae bacterium]|jgi:hypothetical protein|nr:T9SS type A sorting domain-containing protein [Muribaculaceae bacterium]
MRTLKLAMLVMMLYLGCGAAAWAVDADAVLLHKTDATVASTLFSNLRKITVTGGNVVVTTTDGSSTSVAMSDLSFINFGTSSAVTKLTSMSSDGSAVVFPNPADSYIQIKGLNGTYSISIYGVDGALVKTTSASSEDQIDVSGLAGGLYILKVNNQAVKFRKL